MQIIKINNLTHKAKSLSWLYEHAIQGKGNTNIFRVHVYVYPCPGFDFSCWVGAFWDQATSPDSWVPLWWGKDSCQPGPGCPGCPSCWKEVLPASRASPYCPPAWALETAALGCPGVGAWHQGIRGAGPCPLPLPGGALGCPQGCDKWAVRPAGTVLSTVSCQQITPISPTALGEASIKNILK